MVAIVALLLDADRVVVGSALVFGLLVGALTVRMGNLYVALVTVTFGILVDNTLFQQTFGFIEGGNLCAIASAFTFGREDLLPAVFQRIVDELNVAAGGGLEDFTYYLERHIGLDGDEHGPMANRLLQSLCGSDKSRWQVAEQAAVECLEARQLLWDGICDAIRAKKTPAAHR